MTMKREGRVVWFAWFRFRGDPLMIVPGVLKGILQSLSSVLLWVLSLRAPSLFLRWLYNLLRMVMPGGSVSSLPGCGYT